MRPCLTSSMERTGHMSRPRSAHRRTFVRTTVLAAGVMVLLPIALALLLWMLRGSSVADGLPVWASRLMVGLASLAMLVFYAGAALVALGGAVVLFRDPCEDQGVPHAPNRPPERVCSHLRAAVRRSLRPRAPLR